MSGKKIKLLFTMSDGSVQTAEFTLPVASGGGGGEVTAITVGEGLSGDGSEASPLKLALTSVDKSVTITSDDSGNVDLAMNDSLQSLMPQLYPDLRPQHIEKGTFASLVDAYKSDRSTLTKPVQKSFTEAVGEDNFTPRVTIMPAVNGKQLYVDGPVKYDPDVIMLVGCYYIPYDSRTPIVTLFERKTLFVEA